MARAEKCPRHDGYEDNFEKVNSLSYETPELPVSHEPLVSLAGGLPFSNGDTVNVEADDTNGYAAALDDGVSPSTGSLSYLGEFAYRIRSSN